MVFIEQFNFSFFTIISQGIDLDYGDIEWFALEKKRDHSVIFDIASKYCISDSFVHSEDFSISSKGFLPLSRLFSGFLYLSCFICKIGVFFHGKFHAQSCLVGYGPWGCKESDMTEHTHAHISTIQVGVGT